MDNAVEKTIEFSKQTDEKRGEGCLLNALALYDKEQGGQIFWVGNLKEYGYDFNVSHAYFVPPDSKGDSVALNQADSGFDQYPPFTYDELKSVGKPEDVNKLRETIVRTDEGYQF